MVCCHFSYGYTVKSIYALMHAHIHRHTQNPLLHTHKHTCMHKQLAMHSPHLYITPHTRGICLHLTNMASAMAKFLALQLTSFLLEIASKHSVLSIKSNLQPCMSLSTFNLV